MGSLATEQLVEVTMPQMGTSITEGELIAWLKQPGEEVQADETLCQISTDKVDSECPAPVTGTLVETHVDPGQVVEVGFVIARIRPAGAGASPPAETTESVPRENGAAESPPSAKGSRRFYSPVAKRIAADNGVDLDLVSGSGRNGRVTKRDVEAFLADRDAGPKLHSDSPYRPDPLASAADELGGVPQPLSRMRQSIGSAMRRSLHTAATCHTVVECDVTALEQRRREIGVTALPLVARQVIAALRDFPELNATLSDSTITRYERVHLGIAVSLGGDGLIVPVIKDAQELSVEGLAARIKELAVRARNRELVPDDVRGATFTITNPGAFGASIATPVINLPQVAILDLEAVIRRPTVLVGEDGAEAVAIRSMVNLVLGWDHRAIDGVYAARFLSAVRDGLQR